MGALRYFVPLVGIGMAIAGADKLAGQRSYARMYRSWGWTPHQRQIAGAAELAGGTMMACPRTRSLGGAVMAGASLTQLTAELAHGDGGLALARLGVLGAALIALLG